VAIFQELVRKEASPDEKWRLRKPARQLALALTDPEQQAQEIA
jgi:hypothetical protein